MTKSIGIIAAFSKPEAADLAVRPALLVQNLGKDGAHVSAVLLGGSQLQEQRIRHLPTLPQRRRGAG